MIGWPHPPGSLMHRLTFNQLILQSTLTSAKSHACVCVVCCACACTHAGTPARMYVRACEHAPTRMYGSACTTARVRARRARACINSRTRPPDIHFSTPQNNQAHTCLTHGRHATGQGYRAIAATMPQTLKPNETTLLNLAQSVKLNNHPNTAHSLDKMSGQPNSKHRTPRRHSYGKPSTLSSTTQML